MKKIIPIIMAAALALTILPGGVYADTATTTAKSGLNLRKSAGTGSTVLTSVPYGTTLDILDTTSNSSGTWFKVSYGGKTGYISSTYARRSTTQSQSSGTGETATSGTVTTLTSLTIRSEASASGKSVGYVGSGKTASIEAAQTDSRGVVWYKVTIGSKTGWISSGTSGSYVKVTGTAVQQQSSEAASQSGTSTESDKEPGSGKVTASALTLRESAGTSGRKLTSIPKNTAITLYDSTMVGSTVWYKTSYAGKTGYVSGTYVKVTTEISTKAAQQSDEDPVQEESTQQQTITTTEQQLVPGTGVIATSTSPLTMRSGAGSSYSSIGSIPKGTQISLLDQTDVSGTTWYKTTYSNLTGWVSGKYVQVTTAISYKEVEVQTDNTGTPAATGEAPAAQEETATIETKVYGKPTSTLNVRSGAGTENSKVGVIDESMTVEIIGQAAASDGVIWYQITYNSITGYASSKYISKIVDQITTEPEATFTAELDSTYGIGTVSTSTLTVRKGPGTSYASTGSLSSGATVGIFGGQKDASGRLWYRVSGDGKSGYVLGSYISVTKLITTSDTDFENYMTQQGFPESYKPSLRVLHYLYPSWTFVADQLADEFSVAAKEQYSFGSMLPDNWGGTKAVSLISKTSPESWLSKDAEAYDAVTGTYITNWDGSSWAIPSQEIVNYYLDSRNFLNTEDIFQFLDLTNSGGMSAGEVSIAASKINAGWLGSTSYTHSTDGTVINYAQTLADAGTAYNISPIALACIITQELGVESTALSRPQISGVQEGSYEGIENYYKGYYNYFNIGAYVSSAFSKAYLRGIHIARCYGWDTREKAINGGAQYFAQKYTSAGQPTFYYFRFNTLNNKLAHQFSTDIQEATSWGRLLAKAYPSELRSGSLTFRIPIYKNMPESISAMP